MMDRATLPALSARIPARPALERPHNAPLVRPQITGRSLGTPVPATRANKVGWDRYLCLIYIILIRLVFQIKIITFISRRWIEPRCLRSVLIFLPNLLWSVYIMYILCVIKLQDALWEHLSL